MDLSPYEGRWVALVDKQVAGVGFTPEEAVYLAQRNRSKDRFVLQYVEPSGGKQLSLSPLLERIRPFLLKQSQPVYLVGGAVRDALLGRASNDLDFVVPERAVRLAFRMADYLGVPAYVLDRERDTGRVVLKDEHTTLDFARFRGDNLEADLRDRDFTINAMAIPATAVTSKSVIDPCQGRADLKRGIVRPTHADALQKDPLRAMRSIRIVASFGFSMSEAAETAVFGAIPHLPTVSNERIRDEVLKLVRTSVPDEAMWQMHQLGLLTAVLPEIAALDDIDQTAPHHENVLAHTLRVMRLLVDIENALFSDKDVENWALRDVRTAFADWLEPLRAHLTREVDGGVTGFTLLRLGALFHDVGKLKTQTVTETGRIRFIGHESAGSKIAAFRLRQLCVSNHGITHVRKIVQHHMRMLSLLNTREKLSRRAVFRFFRDTGTAGIDVGLLSLADYLAVHPGVGETAVWQQFLAIVTELFQYYFERYTEVVAPPALINGRELMQLLQIQPGPEIGRILRLIEESQAAGDIQNQEQAIQFAKQCHQ